MESPFEELRSHNSNLTSKKLNRLKFNNSSSIHKKEEDTGQPAAPKTVERRIQEVMTSLRRDSQTET